MYVNLRKDNINSFNINTNLNDIGKFLAVRDLEFLSKEALRNKYDIDKVDVLI